VEDLGEEDRIVDGDEADETPTTRLDLGLLSFS